MDTLNQLKENRRNALNAYLNDQGATLADVAVLMAQEAGGTITASGQSKLDAERAKWAELDAEYEAAKVAAGL